MTDITKVNQKRFWAHVVPAESGCWIWQGQRKANYGMYSGGLSAHRVAYELMRGPIPEGLELDHLCRTPPCVNPDHLEPVTRQENWRRYIVTVTHCRNGHEFTPENTYRWVSPEGYDRRFCRACNRRAVADRKARKQAMR